MKSATTEARPGCIAAERDDAFRPEEASLVMRHAEPVSAQARPRLLIAGRAADVGEWLERSAVSLGYRVHRASGFADVAARLPAYRTLLLHASSLKCHDGERFAQAVHDRQLVVAVERGRLLDAMPLAGRVSGWLVFDDPADCTETALRVVLSGACVFPDALDPPAALDRQRLARVAGLTREEQAVLTRLGRGESDRTIARQLALPPGRVTCLVRRLIGKLHFTDRQTAAVFAARQSHLRWPRGDPARSRARG